MYQAVCRLLEMEKEQVMATKGIHRSTSTSMAGRQIASATAPIYNAKPKLTAEQKAWNDAVEAKRAARKEKKS